MTDASIAANFVPETLAELANIAERIGTEAAELVSRRRREGISVAATKSSSVDVVTEADQECEAFIRDRLATERPGDGFFGEETDASETETGVTWVVDPIDGTVNYLYGIPNYAVSIAAVVGDPAARPTEFTVLAGAVIAPEMGERFTATLGGGAYLNGERISPPAGPDDLARTLVATGYSYKAHRRKLQAETYMNMADQVRDVRRMGAASLDLCAVAIGRLDVYYEFGLKPWDWAAGSLVARETGATVCGLELAEREGRDILVAGHAEVTTPFLDLLRDSVAEGLL